MSRTRIGIALLALGVLTYAFFFYRHNLSEVLIADRMSEFVDAVDRHPSLHERKLVVFDLDDTVFMSTKLLGSPTWYYNMINVLRKGGAAKYEAYNVVGKIDKIVQDKIDVEVVEQTTINAIRMWQRLGSTVVGLTSRPQALSPITKRQLQQIGLDFSSKYFSCIEASWHAGIGAFIDGVLYVDDHRSKSDVFAQFYEQIEHCGMTIELLAQADDQKRYVTDLSKLANRRSVDYIGIIYGRALASKKFDLKEANKQLFALEEAMDVSIVPDQYRKMFSAH